jgi:DNA-binding Xre family transcriptional regulator
MSSPLVLDIRPIVALHTAGSGRAYMQQQGFTDREARWMLSDRKPVLVRDSMMQRLCEVLLCEPNDLLRWTGDANDPLAKLNQPIPVPLHDQLRWVGQGTVEQLLADRIEKMQEAPRPEGAAKGKLRLDVAHLLDIRQVSLKMRHLQQLGFSKMEAQTLLSANRTMIRMDVMLRLCKRLYCMPNDLYVWDGPEGHVLSGLRRKPVPDAQALIRGMALADLKKALGGG